MNTLSHYVTIYVPSKDKTGKPVSDRHMKVKRISRELSSLYGGVTVTKGTGSWIDDNNVLVVEPVTLITAYAASIVQDDILAYADKLKIEFNQDSLAVELDKSLILI